MATNPRSVATKPHDSTSKTRKPVGPGARRVFLCAPGPWHLPAEPSNSDGSRTPDPIYFRKTLKATIQQIGWSKEGLFERSDDWCSTAFWYQVKPISKMPPCPDRAARTAGLVEPEKAPERKN